MRVATLDVWPDMATDFYKATFHTELAQYAYWNLSKAPPNLQFSRVFYNEDTALTVLTGVHDKGASGFVKAWMDKPVKTNFGYMWILGCSLNPVLEICRQE